MGKSDLAATLPDIEKVAAKVHEAWMSNKHANDCINLAQIGHDWRGAYGSLTKNSQMPPKELDRGSVRAVYDAIAALT